MEDQEKIKNIVEEILKTDERARNDDKWLVYCVYRKKTKIFIPFEDFSILPSPESITRCRRQIQNTEGKYKAKEKVEINRIRNEEDYRTYYGGMR